MTSPIHLAKPDLVVSIINFRTADLTVACLRSVLDDLDRTDDLDGHVVVVDNCSSDGSAERIEAWIAEEAPGAPVSLIRSATNSGFSGGHNQGMAAREAAFYLVLNSDAVLRPGFFAALMAETRTRPEIGLFAPRLEDEDAKAQISHFRFSSPLGELIRGASTGAVTRALRRYDVPLGIDPDPGQIGWASFACILLSGDMVREIGSMDEGYFLYFEDTEYCWRARKAGWRIAPVLEARAVHHRGGSGPVKRLAAARKRMPAYFYASRSRFFYQSYGWTGLISANLLWYIGRLIANLRVLAGKPAPPANEVEMRDIWINALTPLGDRRATG